MTPTMRASKAIALVMAGGMSTAEVGPLDCQAAREATALSAMRIQDRERLASAMRVDGLVAFFAVVVEGYQPSYRPAWLGEARRRVFADRDAADIACLMVQAEHQAVLGGGVSVVELDRFAPWCGDVVQADGTVVPVLRARGCATGLFMGCLPVLTVLALLSGVFAWIEWTSWWVLAGIGTFSAIAYSVTAWMEQRQAEVIAAILVGLPKARGRERAQRDQN